jgi:hypothetical protein
MIQGWQIPDYSTFSIFGDPNRIPDGANSFERKHGLEGFDKKSKLS